MHTHRHKHPLCMYQALRVVHTLQDQFLRTQQLSYPTAKLTWRSMHTVPMPTSTHTHTSMLSHPTYSTSQHRQLMAGLPRPDNWVSQSLSSGIRAQACKYPGDGWWRRGRRERAPCHPPTGFKKRTKWAGSEGKVMAATLKPFITARCVRGQGCRAHWKWPAGVPGPQKQREITCPWGEGPRKGCQDRLLNKMTMCFLLVQARGGWGCRQDRGQRQFNKELSVKALKIPPAASRLTPALAQASCRLNGPWWHTRTNAYPERPGVRQHTRSLCGWNLPFPLICPQDPSDRHTQGQEAGHEVPGVKAYFHTRLLHPGKA